MIKTIAAAAVAASVAMPAAAQQQCGPYDRLTALLETQYGESRIATFTASGNTVEIWFNPETETWTAIVTNGQVACHTASGTGATFAAPMIGDPA